MKIKVILAIVVVVFAITPILAQPGDPTPPRIPITGGLGYLLAAGIGYGVYALRKRKKS